MGWRGSEVTAVQIAECAIGVFERSVGKGLRAFKQKHGAAWAVVGIHHRDGDGAGDVGQLNRLIKVERFHPFGIDAKF